MEERIQNSGEERGPAEDFYATPVGNAASEKIPPPDTPTSFLDIIYGVFFDPAVTFRRLAPHPPLGAAFVIFTLVNLAGALMGALVGYHMALLPGGRPSAGINWLAPAAPLVAVAGLVFQYLKWLVVSAFLHFTAGLMGGRGSAPGVLTVTGLASLPALVLIPADLLLLLFNTRGVALTVITVILGLVVFVWALVLVVLGLKEVYQFSAGRALITLLLPPSVIILAGVILLVLFAAGFSAFLPLGGASSW
ncbi:YIP1 family protein [Desulfofundulus sp.]|uniref:YIP1 family protein n=1 Tax=Desulfofundulus sp. TaxID=2282750 RepID=UPI003C72F05A